MTRIYTRTGDSGTTGLIGGKRVGKDSPLIEATGSIDELNAHLGVTRSLGLPGELDGPLAAIQDDLFRVGAELATPEGDQPGIPAIRDEDVRRLEREIDSIQEILPPLNRFILPGGARTGAALHLARAVARRAERQCVALSGTRSLDPELLRYLNRLSDLLFVAARLANYRQSVPEQNPTFGR